MTVIKSMSCRFKLLVPPFLCSPQLGSRCASIECECLDITPSWHLMCALCRSALMKIAPQEKNLMTMAY